MAYDFQSRKQLATDIVRTTGFEKINGFVDDVQTAANELDSNLNSHGHDNHIGRNLLVDGDLNLWTQYPAGGWVNPGLYTYVTDMVAVRDSASAETITRESFTPGQAEVSGNPKYYLKWAVASNPTTGLSLGWKIPGVGTAAGEKVTVRVFAKSSVSNTLRLKVQQNYGSGGSSLVTVSSSEVNLTSTWTPYTLTIDVPSIAGKTIGSNSYLWIMVIHGNDTAPFDWSIAKAKAWIGEEADEPPDRTPEEDANLAKWYFERIGDPDSYFMLGSGSVHGLNTVRFVLEFSEKIKPPSISISNGDVIEYGNTIYTAAYTGNPTVVWPSIKTALIAVTDLPSLFNPGDTSFIRMAGGGYFDVNARL